MAVGFGVALGKTFIFIVAAYLSSLLKAQIHQSYLNPRDYGNSFPRVKRNSHGL